MVTSSQSHLCQLGRKNCMDTAGALNSTAMWVWVTKQSLHLGTRTCMDVKLKAAALCSCCILIYMNGTACTEIHGTHVHLHVDKHGPRISIRLKWKSSLNISKPKSTMLKYTRVNMDPFFRSASGL